MAIPPKGRVAPKFLHVYPQLDLQLGSEARGDRPIILLTVKPNTHSAQYRQQMAANSSDANAPSKHHIMTVDRVKGRTSHGRVRMLEFSDIPKLEKLVHTHIRLFQEP